MGLKEPVVSVEKLMVPDGVVGLAEVSVTVAVHVVKASTVADGGEQVTPVPVA